MTPDPSTWQAAAVGHRWLLINVRDDAGDVTLEPSLREGWLDLGAGGQFGFSDSINYTSGTFTATAHTISFDGATSLAGYFGDDPQVRLTRKAFASLQSTTPGEPAVVRPRLIGALLELTTGSATLVLRRAGTLPGR